MLLCGVSPEVFTASTVGAYLAFYTGYDKKTKQLKPSKIIDVLTCRISLRHTLGELNKVLGLAGLTLISASLGAKSICNATSSSSAGCRGSTNAVLGYGSTLIRLHGLYSLYNFRRLFFNKNTRVSMVLGVSAAFALNFVASGSDDTVVALLSTARQNYFPSIIEAQLAKFDALPLATKTLAILGLGVAHFVGIETSGKGEVALPKLPGEPFLPVRPFGYLALIAPLVVAGAIAYKQIVAA